MPFDTTYHLYPTDKNVEQTVTKPGGVNADVYLGQDEHIPYVDSITKWTDSIMNAVEMEHPSQTTRDLQKENNNYTPGAEMVFIFVAIFLIILYKVRKASNTYSGEAADDDTLRRAKKRNYLTYYGDQLNFPDPMLTAILEKRFPYFNKLNDEERKKFLHRVNNFIDDKTFLIHDKIGFREMPVLISAAAVQLSFGLKKYLLPNFTRIHIYPQEYVAAATLHIIEGNVQGHTINFSWKHFLDGFKETGNGQNVGLHEMAHALYYQNFVTDENVDSNFEDNYHEFNSNGKMVFDEECSCATGFYSDYAKTNFQEFWAESVELFFEKPTELRAKYPELYRSMCEILNQDPANGIVCIR